MTFTIQGIIDNYVCIGWVKNVCSPKTKMFWKTISQGVVLLDPEVQLKALQDAYLTVQEAKNAHKDIVVISLKSWLADHIATLAQKHQFHYLTHKLPSGFLTNFETLFATIQQMNEKRKFIASENFVRLTKKEQSMMKRQLAKIEKIYEWVKNLTKKPDLVIVIDGGMVADLMQEIWLTRTPSIVLASTDFPQWVAGTDTVIMNLHNQKAPIYVLDELFS